MMGETGRDTIVSESRPLEAKTVSLHDGLRLVRVFQTEKEASREPVDKWVNQAATLLERQWPRGESPGESYRQKLMCSSHVEHYGLPCSYLLLKDEQCVGHVRLTECFESAGGNAAAATFIVIDASKRGEGLGRQLMAFVEEEAKRLGYHYIYLWTKTAIPFYQKIGYHECHRVSLKRACLKTLNATQVETLEALLFQRSQSQNQSTISTNKSNQLETILLPPSSDGDDESARDVWLKKRLVEQVGSIQVALSERIKEIMAIISGYDTSGNNSALRWSYFLLPLPWQAQIGPSCGLAAIRMVREYYLSQQKTTDDIENETGVQTQLPSLLGEARDRGYTQDGEVFNANHLMDIADTVCGLDCEMLSTLDLQPSRVWDALRKKEVFVLPYDSNARTRLPALLGGKSAHYGVIVGLLVGHLTGFDEVELTLDDLKSENSQAVDQIDVENIFLFVQHSLSSRLSIAPWSAFMRSNQQLDIVEQGKFGEQDMNLKNRIILCLGMRPYDFF